MKALVVKLISCSDRDFWYWPIFDSLKGKEIYVSEHQSNDHSFYSKLGIQDGRVCRGCKYFLKDDCVVLREVELEVESKFVEKEPPPVDKFLVVYKDRWGDFHISSSRYADEAEFYKHNNPNSITFIMTIPESVMKKKVEEN